MDSQITKCSCGKYYEAHSHYCGDQSRCPGCIAKIKKQIEQDKGGFKGLQDILNQQQG